MAEFPGIAKHLEKISQEKIRRAEQALDDLKSYLDNIATQEKQHEHLAQMKGISMNQKLDSQLENQIASANLGDLDKIFMMLE